MGLKDKILNELSKGPKRTKQLKAKLGNDKKLVRKLNEMSEKGIIRQRDGMFFVPDKKSADSGNKKAESYASAEKCTLAKLSTSFGFASPQDGGEDIFIPGRFLMGAMPGDEITVGVFKKPRREGSREGEVLRIDKEKNTVVGTISKENGRLYIVPDNSPGNPIQIKKSADGGAQPGEKAAAQILERGTSHSDHRAGITLRFGSSESAKQCAKAILYGAGIVKSFPPKVREQAKALQDAAVTVKDTVDRKDFTQWSVFTIDSASTKDIDDAVSVSKTPQGYILGVHIADVSHYVKPNSPLDKEAFKRGTSVYYANSVVPMLPRQLSNGICSLNEGVLRLAFSCIINLDQTGKILDYSFVKSVIKSRVKGVYSEINAIFDDSASDSIKEKYAGVSESLPIMHELYKKLEARRAARGSMDIESGEAKILVDENDVCIGVEKVQRGDAEKMIEEFMLLANNCAAQLAGRMKIPFVYRVHQAPEEQRAEQLRKTLGLLGLNADFAGVIPTQTELSELLDKTRGTPLERPVHINILRSMAKAKYSETPSGHFGLSLEDYAHFTSPIRRYPDLAIHRILTDVVNGAEKDELIADYSEFAVQAAQQSSKQELNAMQAERSCDDCYKAEYMKGFIGESFDGIISGVAPHGMYVELENTVEGLVRSEDISANQLDLEEGVSLTDIFTKKTYRIGDKVKIKVAAANVSTGKIDFTLV